MAKHKHSKQTLPLSPEEQEQRHLRHLANVAAEQARREARERAEAVAAQAAKEERSRRAKAAAAVRKDRLAAGAISPEDLAVQLDFSAKDLHCASEHGLIEARPDGYFNPGAVSAALSAKADLPARIRAFDEFQNPLAAEHVGVKATTILAAVHSGELVPDDRRPWRFGEYFVFWRSTLDGAAEKLREMEAVAIERASHRAERRRARVVAAKAARAALIAAIPVAPPERLQDPKLVVHLGPTNSGKTHAALARLIENGAGVYAVPLRLMAQEAHARLSAALGPDQVGLVTGEERINENAPVIACTTEMVPRATPLLVLDEAHWLADPDRGAAWTSALFGTVCAEMHLVGSPDVLPLLERIGRPFELRRYERFTPLAWTGRLTLVSQIKPETIVVAFSRKAVYALARLISESGFAGRVGVLYGAMPNAERRAQIAAFASGELAVMVATDVLGHGVNLPARTVLFAESQKYDGVSRRALQPWEVAQIAGRAGRYGFHDAGSVGILGGLGWGDPSEQVIRAGLEPSVELPEGFLGFRSIKAAVWGPTRRSLEALPTRRWPAALEVWLEAAKPATTGRPYLSLADTAAACNRLSLLSGKQLGKLNPADAWSFAYAPIDVELEDEDDQSYGQRRPTFVNTVRSTYGLFTDNELLPRLVDGLSEARWLLTRDVLAGDLRSFSIEGLEELGKVLTILRWYTTRWPDNPSIGAATVAAASESLSSALSARIRSEITANHFGRCIDCGSGCAPWFSQCDSCHRGGRDWDEDKEDDDFGYEPEFSWGGGGNYRRGHR
jgi:ATP-dependent RNA helicase SUPV3L1/SUV3